LRCKYCVSLACNKRLLCITIEFSLVLEVISILRGTIEVVGAFVPKQYAAAGRASSHDCSTKQCQSSGAPSYTDSPSRCRRFDEAVSLARKHAAPSRECPTGLHWPWWVQAQAAFLKGDLAQVWFLCLPFTLSGLCLSISSNKAILPQSLRM